MTRLWLMLLFVVASAATAQNQRFTPADIFELSAAFTPSVEYPCTAATQSAFAPAIGPAHTGEFTSYFDPNTSVTIWIEGGNTIQVRVNVGINRWYTGTASLQGGVVKEVRVPLKNPVGGVEGSARICATPAPWRPIPMLPQRKAAWPKSLEGCQSLDVSINLPLYQSQTLPFFRTRTPPQPTTCIR